MLLTLPILVKNWKVILKKILIFSQRTSVTTYPLTSFVANLSLLSEWSKIKKIFMYNCHFISTSMYKNNVYIIVPVIVLGNIFVIVIVFGNWQAYLWV